MLSYKMMDARHTEHWNVVVLYSRFTSQALTMLRHRKQFDYVSTSIGCPPWMILAAKISQGWANCNPHVFGRTKNLKSGARISLISFGRRTLFKTTTKSPGGLQGNFKVPGNIQATLNDTQKVTHNALVWHLNAPQDTCKTLKASDCNSIPPEIWQLWAGHSIS